MNARTAMKPMANETVEDQSKSSTRISARASIIVALIMTTGVIVAPITARYIFSDTDSTRISIAKTNQENIIKEFNDQVATAKEFRDRATDTKERELLSGFIEETERTKQEQKEYADKFIENLKNKEPAAAELVRIRSNKLIVEHNYRIISARSGGKISASLDLRHKSLAGVVNDPSNAGKACRYIKDSLNTDGIIFNCVELGNSNSGGE